MKRFDEKGMMIIPNPIKEDVAGAPEVVVVNELYCPEGHNLISSRAVFNNYPGILIRVKKGKVEGLVALSPIYGEKARIALNVELKSGEIYDLLCPICGIPLPEHSPCPCGGKFIALFLSPNKDFSDCICICNRVDCQNAKTIKSGEILSSTFAGKERY